MVEETYLLVLELITRGASSEVRPDQGGHLVLIRRRASSEVTGRIDVSTLLHVNLRGGNIAALLPQGASLTMSGGQQGTSIEIKDRTCVTDFVTAREIPPHQPRPGVPINRDVLGQHWQSWMSCELVLKTLLSEPRKLGTIITISSRGR